jgi:hypothetical protein
MARELLTYIQLAEALGLAPGTVKNIWRTYPYIWLTPIPGKKPNLRGVRFDLDEVVAHLKALSAKENIYGLSHQERQATSVFQISGSSVLQNRQHQTGGQYLDNQDARGAGTYSHTDAEFDVFRNVRHVSR